VIAKEGDWQKQAKTNMKNILMEEDEVFRTGTINPSMDPNYINNCWKNLAIRLNACGNGSCLSWNEWKKVWNLTMIEGPYVSN
jgi:hypothetical protein